jgi:hypothetical protein
MIKFRLAIDADDESQARAIATEVFQAMDVAVAGDLEVTRSVNRQPFWNIVTDLDPSPVRGCTPDDALTRFRWVIRNLPGVSFFSPAADDGPSMMYQWLPDEWSTSMNHEELVHPAVRAAGIWIKAKSGTDTD